MIGGILLCVAGVGASCVLLYNFAVYILPAFLGFAAATWAIHTGAGVIGGLAVGLFAGGVAFGIGHVAFTTARSPSMRWSITLVFAVPATLAGYGICSELWDLFMPATIWQQIFSVVAGVATGMTAMIRIGGTASERRLQQVAAPAHPRPVGRYQATFGRDRPKSMMAPRQKAFPPFHH